MIFEKISIKFEKYQSIDIISSSDITKPTEPNVSVAQYDPYGNDKW